jgi:YesN/AraC family two-component response regulator
MTAASPETAPGRRLRIVVADDSTIYRRNVCMMIGLQPDMEVVAEAENGWDAIEQVQVHRPDVVLIDIRMPLVDGIGAIREIRARFPRMRVIAMSAFGEEDYSRLARQSGADRYLDKSCVLQDLLRTLREVAGNPAH